MTDQPPASSGLGVSIPAPPRPSSTSPHHKPGAVIQAYAVQDRPGGSIIWGTVRPTEADAWTAYERHNPSVSGVANPAQLIGLAVTVEAIPPLFAARRSRTEK